jgi:hypothetical protein
MRTLCVRFAATAFLAHLMLAVGAARAADTDGPLPMPPHLVGFDRALFVGVVWDAKKLRTWLPAGVRPVPENSGGIAIYTSDRGYGISPYHGVYLFADIEGFDSATGMKARWMLQGGYGPGERLPAAIREAYRWPVRSGRVVFEDGSEARSAIGHIAGQEVVRVSIRRSDKCDRIAGIVNYVSPATAAGRFLVNEIPFEGPWCNVDPLSVKITALADDVVAEMVPAKILWAADFSGGTVAFSRPLSRP